MSSLFPIASSGSTPDSAESSAPAVQKSFSCVLCAQRKVKCDRLPGGCSNCSKARVTCIYKAPPPPRRRKKGVREVDLQTRLRVYEDALRELGIDPEQLIKQELSTPPSQNNPRDANGTLKPNLSGVPPTAKPEKNPGFLVSGEGRSRYLENGLWTSIHTEFRDSKVLLDESSDEEGRIGQRIGLHRDPAVLGLPPFETEIRRRMWWIVSMVEGFSEKLAGIGGHVYRGDVKLPSNLNDSDIFPGMKEPPKEREGPTEMMHFLIRCQVGEWLKRSADTLSGGFDGIWGSLHSRGASLAARDRAINDLENIIEKKYLRYCDESSPIHFLSSFLGKSVIYMLRFIAHHPIDDSEIQQSEKDMLFSIARQVTYYQNVAYTTKEMHRFLWHINLHFQWKAFIYLISELCSRTLGPEVEDAWKQVQTVYDFHPTFATQATKRALPIAVGNLTLKAWDAHTAAGGMPTEGEPCFIKLLRARGAKTKSSDSTSARSAITPLASMPHEISKSSGEDHPADLPHQWDPYVDFQPNSDLAANLNFPLGNANAANLDPEQMNWTSWDSLLADFELGDCYSSTAGLEAPKFASRLLASGDYSDLTVTCGSDTYNVHKVIVCPQSSFFAGAVRFSAGKVSILALRKKEAEDGKINLPEDEPAIVKLLMRYLYEADYEPCWDGSSRTTSPSGFKTKRVKRITRQNQCPYKLDWNRDCDDFNCDTCTEHEPTQPAANPLLIHSKMYEIADKYDVAGLKDLVKEKFDCACQSLWYSPEFPVAAHHAFSTTPEKDKGLRDIISKTLASHMELIDEPAIESLLTEFNGFAFGLLKLRRRRGYH
ncbi:hypothetical protein BS50DRAFT_545130 [Corynespora cassiicola Philippines]|uniref:Zn(2)-C6 fungal-type domain-containing protein n=1 Tax=Corynespora cassiicola Philippines TaxID=1448308 RepID=A0A2T2P5C5_CORCC|nr:hypothetical protein BS50DRAFT_545130 [Corynespora cassiicola Philippines]